LVDAPYASLMEPEARYRLHDAIQQQLLQGRTTWCATPCIHRRVH